MADVERSIYFYCVEVDDGEWRRADVLRALNALDGEDRVMSLGDDQYAWAAVDRIPRGQQGGRLRFFRDRRTNLPGWAQNFNPAELPIPDEAGLIEPTHIVLGGDGLIAAEYNHFAPRIPTHFAQLLRDKLGMPVRIGTYVQGSIIEQLDRLDYIRLMEVSLVPSEGLREALREQAGFGSAAAALMEVDGGRRLNLRLTAERDEDGWTDKARGFVKRVLSVDGGDASGRHGAKVLRVEGHDPVTGGDEVVDLLKQKLVRRVSVPRSNQRSKVLDTTAAYSHVEDAIREVRESDLRSAAALFP